MIVVAGWLRVRPHGAGGLSRGGGRCGPARPSLPGVPRLRAGRRPRRAGPHHRLRTVGERRGAAGLPRVGPGRAVATGGARRGGAEVPDRLRRGPRAGRSCGPTTAVPGSTHAHPRRALARRHPLLGGPLLPATSRVAQRFYADVLGWRWREAADDPQYGGYRMAEVDGRAAAGLAPAQDPAGAELLDAVPRGLRRRRHRREGDRCRRAGGGRSVRRRTGGADGDRRRPAGLLVRPLAGRRAHRRRDLQRRR